MFLNTVSIIIPVFNTVGTLETCFQSLVNQSWIDFNVIIVDDGSTDGSYEFCKSWEAKDNRFFVKKIIRRYMAPLRREIWD